jgi:hypothetical protein
MIPDCNDDGYLPPGIHPATLDQIAARFGQESELRQAQMESLRWLGSEGNGGGRPMTIDSRQQLENTRLKLQELEQLYLETKQGPASSEHVRELTLRSLKKRINQFKEEITRFEARAGSSSLKS